MTDIDLIPDDYRMRLTQRRVVRVAGGLAAAILVISLSAYGALAFATGRVHAELDTLRVRNALTEQQQAQLEQLDGEIADLERQWHTLEALRHGADAERLFMIVDKALPEDGVWFQRWEFRRAGTVEPQEPRTVNTGYFVVVPSGESVEMPEWQARTHMSVYGQARDHGALSGFVRSLFERPEVRDVRLQRSTLRRYTAASVVEFELAVVLDTASGAG